jgi:stress-induced morphogen
MLSVIEACLKQAFPEAVICLSSDDNHHFALKIIDASFAQLSGVMRHKAVYRVLAAHVLNGELHALSLKTLAPGEQDV